MTKPAKGSLALVPAAARQVQPKPKDETPSQVISTVEAFEAAVGGRKALLEALSVAGDEQEVYQVLSLIGDPKFDKWPLTKICRDAKISPGQLFKALKAAALARAQILALVDTANAIPEVNRQMLAAAIAHEVPCTSCNGTGTKVDEPSERTPNPIPYTCASCQGLGTRKVPPDLERVRMALEMAQLLKAKGAGTNISNNVNTVNVPAPVGSLVQLQQAIGEILYGRPAPREHVDPGPPDPLPSVDGDVL